jgi:thioredoxin-dependent peroxiredoxin
MRHVTNAMAATAILAATLAAATSLSAPALAALKPGTKAPVFTAPASLGGKEFKFSLAEALKKGPVVLYFYPAAFTTGCTQEAHEFAEAMGKFSALGASVIGVSSDDIGTLKKFSVSECRSKFPVAADPSKRIMDAYDATLAFGYANRTSYVITPDDHVIFEYTALDPSGHVEKTLAAVERWKAAKK